MKKIFLDANILIDYIESRKEQDLDALQDLLSSLKPSYINISALSVHICFYILKLKPDTEAFHKTKSFLGRLNIIPLTESIINQSINTNFSDFEDCLQYFSAIKECDYILTRDKKDFNKIQKLYPSRIKIISNPKEIKYL